MSDEEKNNSQKGSDCSIDAEAENLEDVVEAIESEQTKQKEEVEDKSVEEEIDWKDKYVRLHADWENYRKRMDEQRSDERVRATENLMRELLPLIDDMSHALDYAKNNGETNLIEGFSAISTKFIAGLEKHGLQEIDPKGQPFDPILHQAVSTVEDDSVFEETVRDVYQKGYKLGIKVLRPAMVTITTGGEKRPDDSQVKVCKEEDGEQNLKKDEKRENTETEEN